MKTFEDLVGAADDAEADALRELDRRFALAAAMMRRHVPDLDAASKDHAALLLEFFDRLDEALDAALDDDDDDD